MQLTYTTNHSSYSAVFYVVWLIFVVGLALIPAFIASHKGRPFALWFLFGLFCFLPALVVSIVITDRRYGSELASTGYQPWGAQPGASTAPPGWYPDPGGSASQRYWDGTRWTEHLQ